MLHACLELSGILCEGQNYEDHRCDDTTTYRMNTSITRLIHSFENRDVNASKRQQRFEDDDDNRSHCHVRRTALREMQAVLHLTRHTDAHIALDAMKCTHCLRMTPCSSTCGKNHASRPSSFVALRRTATRSDAAMPNRTKHDKTNSVAVISDLSDTW